MFNRIEKSADNLTYILTNQEQTLSRPFCFKIFVTIFCFCLLFGLFCLREVKQPAGLWGWHIPLVENWVAKGFWRTGGLTIFKGKADPTAQYLYTTSSPVAMYPMYIVQKIIHAVRGKTSLRYWRMHNIALWILSGSLIGFITFLLLTNGFTLDARYRYLISILSSAVYMSHPIVYLSIRLMNFELMASMIIIPLLIVSTLYISLSNNEEEKKSHKIVCVLIAVLTAVNPPMAAMYIAAIIGFNAVSERTLKDFHLKEYLFPFIIVFTMFKIHLLLGEHLLDGITGTVGSSFRFRSGLDGGGNYGMKDGYWSIFLNRNSSLGVHSISWTGYFFLGAVAMALSIFTGGRAKQMKLYCSQVLPLTMLAVIYYFVFAQGALIHPFYYDLLIIIPFTFSIFGWGAGCLLQRAPVKGVWAYLIVAVSIILVMMHLRLFALDYPFPDRFWGTDVTLSPI